MCRARWSQSTTPLPPRFHPAPSCRLRRRDRPQDRRQPGGSASCMGSSASLKGSTESAGSPSAIGARPDEARLHAQREGPADAQPPGRTRQDVPKPEPTQAVARLRTSIRERPSRLQLTFWDPDRRRGPSYPRRRADEPATAERPASNARADRSSATRLSALSWVVESEGGPAGGLRRPPGPLGSAGLLPSRSAGPARWRSESRSRTSAWSRPSSGCAAPAGCRGSRAPRSR